MHLRKWWVEVHQSAQHCRWCWRLTSRGRWVYATLNLARHWVCYMCEVYPTTSPHWRFDHPVHTRP
jgi:hypothetical protein